MLAADGRQNKPIAAQVSVCQLVARWRNRFVQAGVGKDAPQPGRKPAVGADKVLKIIRKTTLQKPPNATHWSRRTRAQHMRLLLARAMERS